jgi:hypothetical protein
MSRIDGRYYEAEPDPFPDPRREGILDESLRQSSRNRDLAAEVERIVVRRFSPPRGTRK